MMPLGCEPAGLKYRRSAAFHFSTSAKGLEARFAFARWALMWSVMQFSTADLVRP